MMAPPASLPQILDPSTLSDNALDALPETEFRRLYTAARDEEDASFFNRLRDSNRRRHFGHLPDYITPLVEKISYDRVHDRFLYLAGKPASPLPAKATPLVDCYEALLESMSHDELGRKAVSARESEMLKIRRALFDFRRKRHLTPSPISLACQFAQAWPAAKETKP